MCRNIGLQCAFWLAGVGFAAAQPTYTPYTFAIYAGAANLGTPPSASDGTGAAAVFAGPRGAALDSSGNLYVADTNSEIFPGLAAGQEGSIRKISPSGVVTTFAGQLNSFSRGSSDGVGSAASFNFPTGVAVDASGNVYVADTFNHTIRKITPGAVVTTLAGLAGIFGSSDGATSVARFNSPYGVAVDVNNNVYVGDTGNNTIRKISAAGIVTTLAGSAGVRGSSDGTGSAAQFLSPQGIAVDVTGNLYVADTLNSIIRKISSAGVVTTFAGLAGVKGSTDGVGSIARFNQPFYVAVDNQGNLFVTDTDNSTLRKITPGGVVTTLGGTPGIHGNANGTGSGAQFNEPEGVAVDATGKIYMADLGNGVVRVGNTAPVIVLSPQSATINYGGAATLTTAASPATGYQWYVNAQPITGATNASYTANYGGNYYVVVSNGVASSTSVAATMTATNRMVNLSTRAQVQSGANLVIVGFSISGPPGTTKQVLLRGIGPALSQFNVSGVLAQPTIALYDSTGNVIATNTGWNNAAVIGNSSANATVQPATSAVMQSVGAFVLPAGSADSAFLATLAPGNYTMPVAGANGTSGISLGEIYELNASDSAVLTNVSARVSVGVGANVGIAGFVVAGPQPVSLLIRAVGPAMSVFGLTGLLAQPSLSVFDSSGKVIVVNTGWGNPAIAGSSNVNAPVQAATSTTMLSVGAFALPTGSADSAVVLTLPPGAYSALVSGVNGTTGTALVEVYQLKQP